jgi:myb proto-oncogene protein
MGAPKQRWTSEEEAALRAGIARHGVGKWRTILKDPDFSSTLCYRSNVDLKDKWRNMNVIVSTSSSRDKGKAAVKKIRTTPKNNEHTTAISIVTSDIDDEIVDDKPVASVPSEAQNASNPKKSHSRLDNIIMEAIKSLNEPTGSHRTTIANYIEEQYWPPSDFDHLLSAKLKNLATIGKLIKVNRKYRIAPSSPNLEGRSPKMLLLEDLQREPIKMGNNDSKTLTRSQVDAELARMATMTAEEASAAAARAVAEAEAIMAEAEAAAREAEAAEADAQAAQAFAEAAFLTLKNRNAAKLVIVLVHRSLCYMSYCPFTCRARFHNPFCN